MLLQRALYGTKQAGALWRKRLDTWLREYGFEPTMYDDCVYVLRTAEGETLAIGTWVDDLVGYSSTQRLRQKFIADIQRGSFLQRAVQLMLRCRFDLCG